MKNVAWPDRAWVSEGGGVGEREGRERVKQSERVCLSSTAVGALCDGGNMVRTHISFFRLVDVGD